MTPSELESFAVLESHQADGLIELEGYRSRDNPTLRSVAGEIDARFERIQRQQYQRLSVVRRDVRFQLCGGESTLVLSGRDLEAVPSAASTHLFRRRFYAWFAAGATIAAGLLLLVIRLTGTARYFQNTNTFIAGFGLASAVGLVLGVGGLLRALRPKLKFGRLRALERYSLLAGAGCFGLMLGTTVIARPRVAEVDTALRRGDLPRARQVVTALIETRGDTGDVAEANDAVSFAEVATLSGDKKLVALDRLVARHGTRSPEAAAQAKEERLSRLRALIEEEKPVDVLAAIDKWWPSAWQSDPDIAEARARAYDIASKHCDSVTCTFAETTLAADAASTEERKEAASSARGGLLSALTTTEVGNETTLARVRRLGQLMNMAKDTSPLAKTDTELATAAQKAATWAAAERAKVALIGAELPVIEELLGATSVADTHGSFVTIDTTRAYLVLDAAKRCRGVYAVGQKEGARAIDATVAERLLSQASGHTATVKHPGPDSPTVARWFEVNSMVAARWKDGQLMELRIGDANP